MSSIAYLTDMSVTTTFALEIFTTDRASHMLGASDLMDEMAFFVLEVLVTLHAVFVFGESRLVLLHFLDGPEVVAAAIKGAGHASVGVGVRAGHLDIVSPS